MTSPAGTLRDFIERLVASPNNEHQPLTNFISNEFVSSLDLMPSYRSKLLLKIADIIEKNAEGLAILESRDQGKPVKLAKMVDIPRCVHNFRFFATAILHHTSPSTLIDEPSHALNYVKHDPIGVAGLISPWNLPLYLLSFKLAPALAAGNTVVCKPSEITSVTAWILMHAFLEAGFPPGVVNMVIGTGASAGQHLVEHPDVPLVSFTGSTLVGKKHWRSLENSRIVWTIFLLYSGPVLSIKARFAFVLVAYFVHSEIYKHFVEQLVKEAKKYTIGDPSTDVTLGAMNSEAHFEKVKSYISIAQQEGGTIQCGGTLALNGELKNGYYIAPTVITGLPDSKPMHARRDFRTCCFV
ncbi:hypothetical protein KIN20_014886 [Parelaphostrongylus tenuis]|uniref:Aldehyde dehydrogenase domain-containing protein n=1 Tax=Parelaphostrongylus tenuis TaxID=148309 RepID=A0AAD5MFC9_PARTN|nr:hypothetical protein KIN20_014886 [Parelaphostrongylus tenuis]